MIHHPDRKKRIYVVSVDPVLCEDIRERLSEQPELKAAEITVPEIARVQDTVEHFKQTALDTQTAKVIILDVRNQTRAHLQPVFSDISRFNRADFNVHCYSVAIGDGPMTFDANTYRQEALRTYLADLRIDFGPAVFFTDPALWNDFTEIQEAAIFNKNAILDQIPARLSRYFHGRRLSMQAFRTYVRAAHAHPERKADKQKSHQKKLKAVYKKEIGKVFGEQGSHFAAGLTRKGCSLPGEALRLNIYPFYFEDWICDLMER